MKAFSEIQDEAKKDLVFDINNIETYALNIASLKGKYLNYLQSYRISLKKALFELEKVYAERHEHYLHYNPLKIDRRDVDIYIKADALYRKASGDCFMAEEKVQYIDSIIKTIDNMSFNINSAIKMHIFKHGG